VSSISDTPKVLDVFAIPLFRLRCSTLYFSSDIEVSLCQAADPFRQINPKLPSGHSFLFRVVYL